MNDQISDLSLKFVRYGLGLGLIGLILGYVPLGHYLMSDSMPSCPSAPIHGHTILLSMLGMPLFGLLYKNMPGWSAAADQIPLGQIKLHLTLSVIGVIGVVFNGTLGYEFFNHYMQQGFYYLEEEGQTVRNLWFGIDGIFLTIYAGGVGILWYIFKKPSG